MPPINYRDQDLVEIVLSAYDYVVSIHTARTRLVDETAIEKSLDFLENAFCKLHLNSMVQMDGVRPRKEED